MKPTILKIEKYCNEIDWNENLKKDCINLIVAPTGSGKTTAFLDHCQQGVKTAFVAPFLSITQQVKINYPDLEIKTGTKATDDVSFAGGRITSFHSAPRLLEMEEIDLLVIDEIHYLVNYAGFSFGMLNVFWETVNKLRIKFPEMKIVALTATPHFVRMADFLDLNLIVVNQKYPTAKPSEIFISRTWTKEYGKDNCFIALYPSRKMGRAWALKHNGAYIDSAIKDKSADYAAILEGRMPQKKVFTSTLLSTGISILDPVDILYTNWLSLSDIVQFSSRPRQGGHLLKVTQTPNPYFLRFGMDKPILNWTDDYEKNFKLLNDFETWYSWQAHQEESDLFNIIYQMLYLPQDELPEIY